MHVKPIQKIMNCKKREEMLNSRHWMAIYAQCAQHTVALKCKCLVAIRANRLEISFLSSQCDIFHEDTTWMNCCYDWK